MFVTWMAITLMSQMLNQSLITRNTGRGGGRVWSINVELSICVYIQVFVQFVCALCNHSSRDPSTKHSNAKQSDETLLRQDLMLMYYVMQRTHDLLDVVA